MRRTNILCSTLLILVLASSCEMNKNFASRKYKKVQSIYDYCVEKNIKFYSRELKSDKFLDKALKQLRAEVLTFDPYSTSSYQQCEPTDSILIFVDHGHQVFGHYSKLIYNFSRFDTLFQNCTSIPDYNFYRLEPRLYLTRHKYGDW
jgi:hypothetical protein